MATKIKTKRGKEQTLLTPWEKSGKFCSELSAGVKMTNDLTVKQTYDGRNQVLTDTERAYRAGYIAARKDSAKLHNWKKKKGYVK